MEKILNKYIELVDNLLDVLSAAGMPDWNKEKLKGQAIIWFEKIKKQAAAYPPDLSGEEDEELVEQLEDVQVASKSWVRKLARGAKWVFWQDK